MKLTNNDKKFLKEIGYEENDFIQIERASKKTTYTLLSDNQKITEKESLKILERKSFLSALARSSFHWSAIDMNEKIYFDSSRYFKQ